MRKDVRLTVRTIYGFACGYCGISEAQVGSEMTVDHYKPRDVGGGNETTNLVYCCHACNEFKGKYWSDTAGETLLHPLHDNAATHYSERSDGVLVALTDRGTRHIERLHLNRSPLVAIRRAHNEQGKVSADVQQLWDAVARMDGNIMQLVTLVRLQSSSRDD